MHIGHRKSHIKRTQYWKHSSVKQPGMQLNPWNRINMWLKTAKCMQTLIFKPLFPAKEPETSFSREQGLPVTKYVPWIIECICVCACPCVCVVFIKATCHLDTQHTTVVWSCTVLPAKWTFSHSNFLLLDWNFFLRVYCVIQVQVH